MVMGHNNWEDSEERHWGGSGTLEIDKILDTVKETVKTPTELGRWH